MMHVAEVRENRYAYMVLIVEPGGKRFRRSCCKCDYTTKLGCIMKRVAGFGLGSSGSALCQLAGCCKHDNEPSSYIKCRSVFG
jgi:hypothetical protein